MKSKASVLKNGTVQYYSRHFDLYFVTEKQDYKYKGVPCNRLIYYVLGKGKHRKVEHRLQKISKPLFDKRLKEAKQYDEWARLARIRDKAKETEENSETKDSV